MDNKYTRVVIKISGEALAGENGFGLNNAVIAGVVEQIAKVRNMGIQIGIIIGGGNFWRGRQGADMDRTTADHMGMLATVINSLAMQDALEHAGVPTRVMTAIEMPRVAEPYILRRAIRHLEKGRVVIMACGTGNPYFSTDTGAALRAAEIQADERRKSAPTSFCAPKTSTAFTTAIRRKIPTPESTTKSDTLTSSRTVCRLWTRPRYLFVWKTISPS